jgi:hypothetical protein
MLLDPIPARLEASMRIRDPIRYLPGILYFLTEPTIQCHNAVGTVRPLPTRPALGKGGVLTRTQPVAKGMAAAGSSMQLGWAH